MTRLYERAARQECAWVQARDVDTSALQSTVNETLVENECFPAAHALMTHQWETPREQVRAMNLATQMLLTHQCAEEDVPRLSELLNGDSDDEEVSTEEQLDQAGEEADLATDELVEGLMNEDTVSSLMCFVFIPLILVIVGGVLCTLTFVIRSILGRFGVGSGGNLSTCLAWGRQAERIFAPGSEALTLAVCVLSGFGWEFAYRSGWAQIPESALFGLVNPQDVATSATGLSAETGAGFGRNWFTR